MGYQGTAGELSEFREFMVDTRRRLRELERPTGTQINSIVQNLPQPYGDYAIATGLSLAATRYLDITITIPDGKTKVTLIAIGNVNAMDETSGGVTVAQAVIEANGSGFVWTSPIVTAAKDAGAAFVANVITPALGFQQTGLTPGGSILVSLAVSALNPSAFPANVNNFNTLTVVATFFN